MLSESVKIFSTHPVDFISIHNAKVHFWNFSPLYSSNIFPLWGILEVTWGPIITQEKTNLTVSIEEWCQFFTNLTCFGKIPILRPRVRSAMTSMTSDGGEVVILNIPAQITIRFTCLIVEIKEKPNRPILLKHPVYFMIITTICAYWIRINVLHMTLIVY